MLLTIHKINTLFFDIDTFSSELSDLDIIALREFYKHYDCCFLTKNLRKIKNLIADSNCKIIECTARELTIHHISLIMKSADIGLENIALISADSNTLKNARALIIFTVMITNKILKYEDFGGFCSDFICSSLSELLNKMKNEECLYYGEKMFQKTKSGEKDFLKMKFNYDLKEDVPIISSGRYFGTNHYLHNFHILSNAIIYNKKESSKMFHKFDMIFSKIFAEAINDCTSSGKEKISFNGICAVPDKPGKDNKYIKITSEISKLINIENLSNNFKCTRAYDNQKNKASFTERQDNIKNAFTYERSLSGKNIALIDDIMTTGSTLKECIKELYKAGAQRVICFVLAFNQFDCQFPSSSTIFNTNSPLFFNSQTLKPFYRGEEKEYNDYLTEFFSKLNKEILQNS